jgi:hypothetical protein
MDDRVRREHEREVQEEIMALRTLAWRGWVEGTYWQGLYERMT